MDIKLRLLACLVIGLLGLFNCAPVQNNTTVVNTLSPSSTPEIYQQLPTRIPTHTPYPTPIPVSSEQITQAYFHLGESNTCELPCFLGVAPGGTGWQDTTTLFAPYTTSILEGIVNDESNLMPYVINLVFPELEIQMKYYISLESDEVLFIRMNNSTPLSEFLTTLEFPDQVLVWSAGIEGMGSDFNLAVAYFKRGVIAFLSGRFQVVDGKAQICAEQLKQIELVVLWSPEDIRFIGDFVGLDGYGGIESLTDTTVEEFYENYSKESTDYCIKLNY